MRTALVTTNANTALDFSNYASITGATVTASEPDDTYVRFLLGTYGGTWQKYDTSTSAWADTATQTLTAASVISEGMTASEVTALTSDALATFAGNKMQLAVALGKEETTENVPGVTSVAFAGKSNDKWTQDTVESDEISLTNLSANVEILGISVEKTETGGGTVEVQGALKSYDGTWSDYAEISTLVTSPATTAKAIKLKGILTSPTPGTSSATLSSVSIKHRTDNVAIFTEGTGVCVTTTRNFVNPITNAHLVIKHPVVADTDFTAEVSLRAASTTVTGEVLGTGTGEKQTYTLANTTNLASHGFALYFDGEAQSAANYSFSPSDGQVTCTADDGVAVTCDYIYDWENESFQSMTHDTQYPDHKDSSMVDDQFDYIYTEDGDQKGSVGCVRVNIIQGTGTVKSETLGTATGSLQSFKLAHHARSETLAVYADGTALASSAWRFKDTTDILQVTATAGAALTASYKWAARPTYMEDLRCTFNE